MSKTAVSQLEPTEDHRTATASISDRQVWLGVLARARPEDLQTAFHSLGGEPPCKILRSPEVGAVMIEARAGGTGSRFNAAEATVTRCVVQVGKSIGVSYALGRDRARARLAAIADAMLQEAASDSAEVARLIGALIEPTQREIAQRRLEASVKAAATKVEFFTMVRGEG